MPRMLGYILAKWSEELKRPVAYAIDDDGYEYEEIENIQKEALRFQTKHNAEEFKRYRQPHNANLADYQSTNLAALLDAPDPRLKLK